MAGIPEQKIVTVVNSLDVSTMKLLQESSLPICVLAPKMFVYHLNKIFTLTEKIRKASQPTKLNAAQNLMNPRLRQQEHISII